MIAPKLALRTRVNRSDPAPRPAESEERPAMNPYTGEPLGQDEAVCDPYTGLPINRENRPSRMLMDILHQEGWISPKLQDHFRQMLQLRRQGKIVEADHKPLTEYNPPLSLQALAC